MGSCVGKTATRVVPLPPVIQPLPSPPQSPQPVTLPPPLPVPPLLPVQPTSHPLQTSTYDNTKPYFPSFTEGKCVKVYDGDTVHLAAIVDKGIYRFMIRMYGYDSPELRSKNPEEKKAALVAKEALQQRIGGKLVQVKILNQREKYGRLLAILYDSEGEINTWMVTNKYGKPYFGGTKDERMP